MKARHGLGKVAVIDWDVHHGNGTQAIYWDRADVLTISLHQNACYPTNSGATTERGAGRGRGRTSTCRFCPAAATTAISRRWTASSCPPCTASSPS
jgi:acetoin utilization deacetylase AcuC-like enzyme